MKRDEERKARLRRPSWIANETNRKGTRNGILEGVEKENRKGQGIENRRNMAKQTEQGEKRRLIRHGKGEKRNAEMKGIGKMRKIELFVEMFASLRLFIKLFVKLLFLRQRTE